MNTETTRKTTTLSLAMFIAGAGLAGCGVNTDQAGSQQEVGGATASPLYDNDRDGHDDFFDGWRFKKGGDNGHRRNKCPVVQAVAAPQVLKVGETTKLKGFAQDLDNGPRSLKYQWTVAPATIGSIANDTSKRTTFKCLMSGVAHLTFTATDGDCKRGANVTVYCKPTTAARCGDGKVDPGETCDGNCPATCNDNNACTTDASTGSAAACTFQCTHKAVTTCASGDSCCPSGCARPGDMDCQPPPCGNGVVDPGETCDGNCPTTCNDGNACTSDVLTGTASACNVKCTSAPLTVCTSGDTCCPSGCSAPGDSDCTNPFCGDGKVNGTETCDGNCPTTCNDSNACTTDVLTGTAGACNVKCTSTPVTACTSGDGCCAPGCKNPAAGGTDSDCVVVAGCGNGVLDSGETCDDTSATKCKTTCNDGNACTTDVLTGTAAACNVTCANTAITVCDTNLADTCCAPGCNANSDVDCMPACGNNVKEPGETCDPSSSCITSCNDGNACTTDVLTGAASTCNSACTNTQITACTNGDGCCAPGCKNPANGGTDSDCAVQAGCGNGVLDSGETCDDSSPTKCANSCNDNLPCTNDVKSGSSSTCDVRCSHTPVTVCSSPDGDQCCDPSICNANTDVDCISNCGNGVTESGETCDGNCPTAASCNDNNACTDDIISGDAASCTAVCSHTPSQTPTCLCGNGHLDSGETCDGNCPTNCDDGNACTVDTLTGGASTCNAVCTHTPAQTPACLCGNGTVDPGEKCDGNCPTSCPASGNACTPNRLTGSAATCDAACVATPITTCTSGDGCCPTNITCAPGADAECGDACSTCESSTHAGGNRNCPDSKARCDGLQGITGSTSPMPGVSKAQLCRQIVDCMHANHCAQIAATDCLCGPDADPNVCFTKATIADVGGACKTLIGAGGESNQMADLANRFTDPTYAIGAADAVIETCDQFYCFDECL